METQPTDGRGAGAGYPRWVILDHEAEYLHVNHPCSAAADAKTEAATLSSGGHTVRVSLDLRAPPAASRVCYTCSVPVDPALGPPYMRVAAAHGDSLLVLVSFSYQEGYEHHTDTIDKYLYNAGAAAAADPPRPPSLVHLPAYYNGEETTLPSPLPHDLDEKTTGLLRRGEAEADLVVADLIVKDGGEADAPKKEAELLVLRSGEWSVVRAPIVHDDGKAEELSFWETDMVVPVGDRRLCWVDLCRGIILCDMFDDGDETLRPRYFSLPIEPPADDRDRRRCQMSKRRVCVTNGGTVLKRVDVSPRCCCGRRGATQCDHSSGVFVINTWTLHMDGDDDDMAAYWTMDAMVDATELWSLDAYAGVPRINPQFPIVSMDDPDIICFQVPEEHKIGRKLQSWYIMLDTSSKTLMSVCRLDESSSLQLSYGYAYFVSTVSHCFNSSDDGGFNNDVTKPALMIIDDKVATKNNIIANDSLQSSCESSAKNSKVNSPKEILALLQEIPELSRDDLLRAYSFLCYDNNGRRLSSLLGLPMSLRKPWLLMEIKASEACSVCCACRADMQNV